MTVLFVSDLHIDDHHPEIAGQFMQFLAGEAREAERLYILGDLFEVWIGDDDPDPMKRRVIHALHDLSQSGVACHFMRGNRDFLTGEVFAEHTGCHMLEDLEIVDLFGTPALLLHGDTLCVDDRRYQEFRRMVRSEEWQRHFLSQPVHHRMATAGQARDASRSHTRTLPAEIMDASQAAVNTVMREKQVYTMIHGHTHRPAIHHFDLDDRPATRIVLGDWYEQGSVLRWSSDGYSLDSLQR
jgi:UDP-2,3-diacylglucosamine hydrolase